MKKYIVIVLSISICIQMVGCYSYQDITKEELLDTNEYEDLRVTTTSQITYQFESGDYAVSKDSIYGNGKIVNLKLKKRDYKEFNGGILLSDIESYQFDSFNGMLTVIGIGTIVGIVALIASSINVSMKGFGGSGNGNQILKHEINY